MVLCAAVVVALLWFLVTGGGVSSSDLAKEKARLSDEKAKSAKKLDAAMEDVALMKDWRARSLPADPATAKQRYTAWLIKLVEQAKFVNTKVAPGDGAVTKTHRILTFQVHGLTSMDRLTAFLFNFYSAGHLHKITRLDMEPTDRRGQIKVAISIEALSLPDSLNKEKLTEEKGKSLKSDKLADYRVIADRDVFSAYRLIERPSPFDIARYTFVNALIETDRGGEVWLNDRPSGKEWKLHTGEEFKIGELRGAVKSISGVREVIIVLDGRARRYALGDNLREGVEVREPQRPNNEEPKAAADDQKTAEDEQGAADKASETADRGRRNDEI